MVSTVIKKFINQKGYLTNKEVIGIIFYGSYKYASNTSASDIDLLIITNENHDYRGTTRIDNIKIDYFEKSFANLLEEISTLNQNPNRYLFSVFKNGEIILDKDYSIAYLKDEVLLNSKPKIKHENKRSYLPFLLNTYSSNINEPTKDYLHSIILENIRHKYHEENALSNIPMMKTTKIYKDANYAKTFYCVNLPKDEFRKDFFACLEKEKDLIILLSQIDKERELTFEPAKTKLQTIYESTTVSNALEKCYLYQTTESKTIYQYYYNLTLHQIYYLYCHKTNTQITDEIYIKDPFMILFNACLKTKQLNDLQVLFNYVTNDFKIDYTNYLIRIP